jgi:methionyl-tRNA formyltransferase
LRIAYFGLPLGAVLLANDGHTMVYAAVCRSAPGLRRLSSRIAPARTYLYPEANDPETMERVRAAEPELVVSWFWTAKLPPQILAVAPTVGVHPSLLPRHRGPDPYFWAIDIGDAVTGVTAHRLDAEYDRGAILAQRRLPINPRWHSWDLARALDRPGLALLREVVSAHAKGTPPRATPQDEAAATWAPEPSDEELEIRWSWPAERIERRVRAAAPWPGAWAQIGSHTVSLLRVHETNDFPRTLRAAEGAVRPDGLAVVRAGENAVELLEGRSEGSGASLSRQDLARLVTLARA